MPKLSKFQETIIYKIGPGQSPFRPYGLQVRTCQSLINIGLAFRLDDGGIVLTNDGVIEWSRIEKEKQKCDT